MKHFMTLDTYLLPTYYTHSPFHSFLMKFFPCPCSHWFTTQWSPFLFWRRICNDEEIDKNLKANGPCHGWRAWITIEHYAWYRHVARFENIPWCRLGNNSCGVGWLMSLELSCDFLSLLSVPCLIDELTQFTSLPTGARIFLWNIDPWQCQT